ncbi:unnamed protein product [Pylaiella littoralis]
MRVFFFKGLCVRCPLVWVRCSASLVFLRTSSFPENPAHPAAVPLDRLYPSSFCTNTEYRFECYTAVVHVDAPQSDLHPCVSRRRSRRKIRFPRPVLFPLFTVGKPYSRYILLI